MYPEHSTQEAPPKESQAKWYVPSKVIQSLERELRGERGCLPRGSRPKRQSRCLRELKEAAIDSIGGMDLLIGITEIYRGKSHFKNPLLCMIYLGDTQCSYVSQRAMEGLILPALSIVGVTEEGTICAGYGLAKSELRTSSWGPNNYPVGQAQVKRVMDASCAWTLINKETDQYQMLPEMVMLLVQAVNQSKL